MKKLLCFLAALLVPLTAHAAMYEDGRNADLPAARQNILPAPTVGACLVGNGTDWLPQPCGVTPSDAMVPSAGNALLPAAQTNLAILPHVASNAALAAAPTTAYPSGVVRDSYASSIAPPLFFLPSTGTCESWSWFNDGGTCVNSAGGNSWWSRPGQPGIHDVRQFGAKGDGTTDDTAAVQRAINGARQGTLNLGDHIYSVGTLHCYNPTNIIGTQSGPVSFLNTGVPNTGFSGFKARTQNQTMFDLQPGCMGSKFESFFVGMGTGAGYNSSGWAFQNNMVSTGSAPLQSNMTFRNLHIDYACGGIDANGSNTVIDQVRMSEAGGGANCYGIRVGHNDNSGVTTANVITRANIIGTFIGARVQVGILLEDAGGIYISNNDITYANVGTMIRPGNNQQVTWAFMDNTVLGDTSYGTGLYIETGAANATIKGIHCTACWASSTEQGPGISIQNTSGVPYVQFQGFYFNGLQVLANGDQGIVLNAGTNIAINDAIICGNNKLGHAPTAGIVARNGVGSMQVRGGAIGGSCGGVTGTQDSGINFIDSTTGGLNPGIFIQGVSLLNNAVQPIGYGLGVTGQVLDNPGFNPGIADAVVPSGSPWAYTAGLTRELVCIRAGTVSSVVIGGQTFATASPACMTLGPQQLMTVTYTVAPTVARSRL